LSATVRPTELSRPVFVGGDCVGGVVGGVGMDVDGTGVGSNVEADADGDDDAGADDLAGDDDFTGGADLGGAAEWVVTATVGAPAGDGLGAAGACEPGVPDGSAAGPEDVTAVLMAPASLLRCGPAFA
jgi:hypothetical protein